MPKIIQCKCYYGGYDLCHDCGGSGVIIMHGKNDYRPLKAITKKLPSTILPPSLTIREKVLHHVKIDESLIEFLKKKFYRFSLDKRNKIIEILKERLTKWKTSAVKIADKSLSEDVQEYINELAERIMFFSKAANEKRQKASRKRVKQPRPKKKK